MLVTETVQLDPRRNPYADKLRVEAEMVRTIGATHAIWLPRGLTRDYDDLGTNGHVDIVATIPSPGRLLVHAQTDPAHPDHQVTRELRAALEATTDAAGRNWDIIDVPAPATLRDAHGFVDWSYVNHHVVNDGVIACGFGEEAGDQGRERPADQQFSVAHPNGGDCSMRSRTSVRVSVQHPTGRGLARPSVDATHPVQPLSTSHLRVLFHDAAVVSGQTILGPRLLLGDAVDAAATRRWSWTSKPPVRRATRGWTGSVSTASSTYTSATTVGWWRRCRSPTTTTPWSDCISALSDWRHAARGFEKPPRIELPSPSELELDTVEAAF